MSEVRTEPRIIPPEEARALAGAATPGPWKPVTTGGWDHENFVVRSDDLGVAMQYALVWKAGDARLIAAAPDLVHTAAVLGELVTETGLVPSWIEERERRIQADAWDEGYDQAVSEVDWKDPQSTRAIGDNPYRAARNRRYAPGRYVGENAAALALHGPAHWCMDDEGQAHWYLSDDPTPCPTARALGVEA